MIIKIDDDFKINIIVHDKLKIDSDQYINLWISSVSFWSFLQSHSFIITFCEKNEQTTLNLLIDFQKKIVFKFQWLIRYESESNWNNIHMTLFINSHEINAFLKEFKTVFMIVSQFKIITQLSYLRQLIRNYNNFIIRTRRIRLIWQLKNIDKCVDHHWWINR